MFYKSFPLIFITLVFLLFYVECQICTRREIVRRTARVPYTQTYRETYRANCWFSGKCRKTRIKSTIDYKVVMNSTTETVKYCCDGYIRKGVSTSYDDEYKYYEGEETLTCMPVCVPACRNGQCQSPGICSCDPGYEQDPENPHSCLPVCPDDCQHGICTTPGNCLCNIGYHPINGTCQPICTEPCVNAVCAAPDTCECNSGYRKTVTNECDPYCSKGCENGICGMPEVCVCFDGYIESEGHCIPHCDGCSNGTCISPNVCKCNFGYKFLNESCKPICTNDCGNGTCIAPDICKCDVGYRFNHTHQTCEPMCNNNCKTGFCTEPEVCINPHVTNVTPSSSECIQGYYFNTSTETCEPICKNCEGHCVAPLKCICDHGYIERNETEDSEPCDCFENCTDELTTCDRTVCVFSREIDLDVPSMWDSNYNFTKILKYDDLVTDENEINYSTSTFENNAEYSTARINSSEIETSNRTPKQTKSDNRFLWIYIAITVLVLTIFGVLLILILKRKSLRNVFTAGSYVVKDRSEQSCAQRDVM